MKKIKFINFITFVSGATSFVNLNVFGQLSIAEIIIVFCLPWLYTSRDKFKEFSQNRKTVGGFIGIWIIAVIISDYLNKTQFNLFLKGVGHPIMILFTFLFFNKLLQLSNKIIYYFSLGLVVGYISNYYTNNIAQENFRFGIFNILTSISFVIAYHLRERKLYRYEYFLFFIMIVIGALSGSRSNALFFLFLIVVLFLSHKVQGNSLKYITRKSGTYLLILIVALFVIQEGYVFLVKQKIFANEYQGKFEKQLESGLPVIFSGRTEIFSSIEAIKDSPLIGHGSWARNLKYTNIYFQKQDIDISNFDETSKAYGFDKIPSHSFFFGSWVEHGILASCFFIFFGKILLQVIMYLLSSKKMPAATFLFFTLIVFLWHLLFSPLGSDKRIFVALILSLNSFYKLKSSGKDYLIG